MKLAEALAKSQCVKKHIDGAYAGWYSICKMNISPGWCKKFTADDPEDRSPFSSTIEYGPYDGLEKMALYYGEEGWETD